MSETPNYVVTHYPQGTFSWADCISTDAAKSKQFYADVMGWDSDEMPMGDSGAMYTMFKHDGHYVAGLGPAQVGSPMPSHWMSYVAVDDVDAIAPKVTELGGKILFGPMDVFESGRMISIQDPTGAVLGLWQAKNHIGAGLVNQPGAMLWNELLTRDVEAAKTFYNKLLGWEYVSDETGYLMIKNNGRYNGGMMQMDDSYGEMPPVWNVYFNVPDIEAAFEKVKAIGGTVVQDQINSAGDAGRFAIVVEPTGATAMLMESHNVDAWDVEMA